MPTIYINPYIHAAADWWVVPGKTCVAAYQPIGAASLAASYVNLANPGTYDAAPGVAPTWASATGWTFNGSTQYLTTGITPPRGPNMVAIGAICRAKLEQHRLGISNGFVFHVWRV